ncbi:LuxR family transcriptional regulator [Pseudonocardia kongjuensis]|uniref:LuxR family transcriptional regulator n=1 Tax=Pseudonocardia kongjuensis TaxID=102227 RepID=A0ABP4IG16_9PSEU
MRLRGRTTELRALSRLLDAARAGTSGVLVLRGEPGIGKTALLDAAVAAATGMRVLTVTGVESERALGNGALHRLTAGFLDRRQILREPQRAALDAALGLGPGRSDRFLVCLAVLTLLTDAAGDVPLLCVCDDAQWLDHESLQTLTFLARRLDADPVVLLFGVRDTDPADRVPELDGLPALRIGALPPADARELAVEAAQGRFDERELDRVVAESGGNPLAVRELATEWLHARGRSGDGVPLAHRLPMGRALEDRFRDRILCLPEPVRVALAVVAADPTGDAELVTRALAGLDVTAVSALDAGGPASDLLVLDPVLGFRHPLMRSAAYSCADEPTRRRVHAALAAATPDADADRRAWHLAAATDGADEAAAAELESAAGRARDRAGYSAESAFLAAAADLSTDPELRAERRFAAGVAAIRAGMPERADAVLRQVPSGAGAVVAQSMALARGAAALQLDRIGEGMSLMLGATAGLAGLLDGELRRQVRLETLQTLVMVPWLDPPAVASVLGEAEPPDPDDPVAVLLQGHRAHLIDGSVAGLRAVVDGSPGTLPADVVTRWAPLLSATTRELLDDRAMDDLSVRILAAARSGGAATTLRSALVSRALTETFAGRLDDAEVHHGEAGEVAAVTGGAPDLRRAHDALLRAWRDDGDGVLRAAGALPPAEGAPVGGAQVQLVRTARAVLALGAGRYADAAAAALEVYRDDPPYWGHLALPDLVEGAVRGGDRDAARAALDRFAVRARGTGTPWALGLLARSAALLAAAGDAEALYREAVDRLRGTVVRTDLARAHLLYGEWLRRRRRRTDARRELAAAHALFTQMGAPRFAERARTELAAAGAATRPAADRPAAGRPELTPQEHRIARLAAAGSTNSEIAAELVISANTVEYHLRKVFGKIGVRSRRELGAAGFGSP